MPRIILNMEEDIPEDGCPSFIGDRLEVTHFPLLGGTVVLLGRPDFVECYSAKIKAAEQLTTLRGLYAKLLEENKDLNEALTRVQNRCHELLMKNRKLEGTGDD